MAGPNRLRRKLSIAAWSPPREGVIHGSLSLDVDEAHVPPTPFARVPLRVLIGAVREVPSVRDGQVVVARPVTLSVTIDHRLIDGFQAGTLAAEARRVFADPWSLDPEHALSSAPSRTQPHQEPA